MPENVLTVRNLEIEARDRHAQTGWKRIVDDISFDLPRGSVLGLIGESGAGKSTIGLAALGYTRAGCRFGTGSSVILGSNEMTALTPLQAAALRGREVAYIAQSAAASFSPTYRLIDQICDVPVRRGLMRRDAARDRSRELFHRLHLPDPEIFGERYPHQVSGGQLQRAMIAMALFNNPDLVVFDEPTTALDVVTQVEVLLIAREIIAEFNVAALYISHDLSVVAQIADEVIVLKDGREVEFDDTRTIIENPEQAYTKALVTNDFGVKNDAELDTSGMTDTALQVRSVTAGYTPESAVLSNVDVTLKRGKVLAIVGESGSGKSTLARVITGLLPARSGQILLDDAPLAADLRDRSHSDVSKIQLIHQLPDTALNPRMRIGSILDRAIRVFRKVPKTVRGEIARELMAAVRLDADLLTRYPSQLSGGQKQRVCIARALAAEPEVLVCDEVTSALDRLVAIDVLAQLEELRVLKNLSVIMITHDMSVVRAVADEVCILLQGEVVEFGPTDEVLSEPYGHDYTERLLTSVPKLEVDWLDGYLAGRVRQPMTDVR
ncbi:ABC transporter ATP-binding protein [Roseovarius sp. 2305UL8-3]|uniref:ABC transporter ATP-binding protein n=1 Tax=Roseovarius conchicola TaxID=3121636 RepID=UPI003528F2D3